MFAAYAVSRYTFRGRRVVTTAVLSTQMFPGILLLLPLFLIFVRIQTTIGLQLNGSYTGLIITYMTSSLPFAIWMLVGYLDSIPPGSWSRPPRGRLRAAASAVPGRHPHGHAAIVAVAVFAFITSWGEVLFASMLTSERTRTLAIGLQAYASQSDVHWNQLMAASVVVSIPVLVGFLSVQRYLIRGLTAGAVK